MEKFQIAISDINNKILHVYVAPDDTLAFLKQELRKKNGQLDLKGR